MNRRAFLLGAALAVPLALAVAPVDEANAAVSMLIPLDELVNGSTFVVVAAASERRSAWEDLPSGKRIVTYTKINVERAVVGAPDKEVWVRTLGGVVDKIGQSVAGEAQITLGSRGLFFLKQAGGAIVVNGMAQGHYPIVSDDKGVARLTPSPDPGMLMPRRGPTISAHEQLVGGKLEEGVALVVQTRKARDEKK